jgi:hypothetical protein
MSRRESDDDMVVKLGRSPPRACLHLPIVGLVYKYFITIDESGVKLELSSLLFC